MLTALLIVFGASSLVSLFIIAALAAGARRPAPACEPAVFASANERELLAA